MEVAIAQNLSPRVEEAIKRVRRVRDEGGGSRERENVRHPEFRPPISRLRARMPPHSALPAALLVPDSPSQVLGGDTDELDGPVFDPIEFINKKFADERSLEGLDKAIASYAEEIAQCVPRSSGGGEEACECGPRTRVRSGGRRTAHDTRSLNLTPPIPTPLTHPRAQPRRVHPRDGPGAEHRGRGCRA
jgi:hypothetical protein